MNYKKIIEGKESCFPYSIKRSFTILFSPSELKKLSEKEILNITNNLEKYFNLLLNYDKVNSSNIIYFSTSLLHKLKDLQNYIILSKQFNRKKISNIIDKEINNIEFENSNYEISGNLNDKSINFNNTNEVKNYLIELIDTFEYPFSDYMEKILINSSDSFYKFKKNNRSKNLKFTRKRFINFLNDFNWKFKIINDIFERKGDFNYVFFANCYFNKCITINQYLYNFLVEDKPLKKGDSYYNKNIKLFITLFYSFLTKIKDIYTIQYQELDTFYPTSFYRMIFSKQKEIIIYIFKNLKDKNIFNFFYINSYSDKSVRSFRYIVKEINEIIEDLKQISNVKIIPQALTPSNNKIIQDFKENVEIYKNKYSEFTISQITFLINNIYPKDDLIRFNVNYNNLSFKIRISQYNLNLFQYIYYHNKNLVKDRVFRVEDFDRIFYFIKDISYKYSKFKK